MFSSRNSGAQLAERPLSGLARGESSVWRLPRYQWRIVICLTRDRCRCRVGCLPQIRMEHPMRASILALVLSSVAASAHAQSAVSGGMLYGGPSQAQVLCYVYNNGLPAQVINHGIADENGNAAPLAYDSCGYRLIPSRGSCALVAHVTNAGAHSCHFQGNGYQGAVPNLRGALQILDSRSNVLTSVSLQ